MVTVPAGAVSQIPSPPTTITTSVISRSRLGLGRAAMSPRLNSGSALAIRWSRFPWTNGEVRMLTRLPKSRATIPPDCVRFRPVAALTSSTAHRTARKPTFRAAAQPSGLARDPSSLAGAGVGTLGKVLTRPEYQPTPRGHGSATRSRFSRRARLDAVQQRLQAGVERLGRCLLLVGHRLVGEREPVRLGELGDHGAARVEVRRQLHQECGTGVPPLLVA